MDLAAWMIVSTCVAFAVGAAFALAWSIVAGQWRRLEAGARMALDDDDDAPGGALTPGRT